ncbi:MAG: hypothetical protein HYZ58_04230 [Acidobacteria bacterium]|nr:hypothetical protein [Acidobacteriota bacterium]MBI3262342.1 hypothetical protein [Acidobacteriota bacterium]
MRRCVWLVAVALFVVIGAGVRRAGATMVVPASLDELAAGAVAIFHGRVADVQPRWEPGRRRIESFVAIEVVDYLKGNLGPLVVIRVPGGELGPYRSIVVGAPTLTPGDEVILFVGANGPSYPYVLGLDQGVFRVVRTNARQPSMVLPPPVASRTNAPGRVVRGDPQRRPPTLEAFVSQVRALVEQVAGGARAVGASR